MFLFFSGLQNCDKTKKCLVFFFCSLKISHYLYMSGFSGSSKYRIETAMGWFLLCFSLCSESKPHGSVIMSVLLWLLKTFRKYELCLVSPLSLVKICILRQNRTHISIMFGFSGSPKFRIMYSYGLFSASRFSGSKDVAQTFNVCFSSGCSKHIEDSSYVCFLYLLLKINILRQNYTNVLICLVFLTFQNVDVHI